MNEQHEPDEAFARLRASDPASDARLDTAALRRRVDERIADTDSTAPGRPGEDAVVTPLRRRPTRWLQVAAAVAGVVAVGGAGFAVGRGSDPATTAAAPAISLQQPGAERAAGAAADTSELRMFAPGRVVFTAADGLGDGTGRATAWGLDAAAVTSADSVARAASALGVSGDPTAQEGGGWVVGSTDGSGPSVSLYPDGSASLSYYDPSRDPWNCADGDTGSTAESEPCTPQGEAPSAEAATAALREAMAAIGLDPAEFQFSEPETYDGPSTYVTAERVVDGQATGLLWSATVVGDGVQSLSGPLAPVVDLGEYDLVGAATAVARMADPRFGSGYSGVMPLATADGAGMPRTEEGAADPATADGLTAEALAATDDSAADATAPEAADATAPEATDATAPEAVDAPAPEATVPPTASAGAPIDWPVQRVTITGARLGLSQVYQSDGSLVLAPAYELTGDDGSTWSVIAVADGGLSFG